MIRPPGLWTPKTLSSYNPIPRGCILYLPLWSPRLSGSKFKSVDTYGHTATVTNAIWTPTGRDFDGNGDYISIPDSAVLDATTTNAMTLVVWIKPEDPIGGDSILSHGAYGTDGYIFVLRSGSSFELAARAGETYSDEGIIVDDAWQMVGVTFTNTAAILYYNGAITSQNTIDTHILNPTARTLYIGQSDTSTAFWDGDIGAVWFYNRVLSAGEMAHIYNSTKWRY